MLKKLGIRHFRERWKTILRELNPNYEAMFPLGEFLERVEHIYNAVETRFFEMKGQMMPKSTIRKPNGDVVIQDRHSNLPFNYLYRKICEALDIYDWHNDLPLLRSTTKLHNLDDIKLLSFASLGSNSKDLW